MGGLICNGQDFGGHGGRIEGLQESFHDLIGQYKDSEKP
jgi:hypothetical protein